MVNTALLVIWTKSKKSTPSIYAKRSNKQNNFHKREMLMSAFRALVKNPVKKSFYGKRKEKQLIF